MPPEWLLWLLPVPVATTLAIVWVSWRTRSRGPQEPADSVQAHERFKAAMSAPVPPVRSRGRSGRDAAGS